MIGDLLRRLRLVVSVAVLPLSQRDTAQVQFSESETFDRVPKLGSFGLASRAPAGATGIVVGPGGDRAGSVLIATRHPEHLGPELEAGETALFNAGELSILLGLDGVASVHGDVAVDGQLSDFRTSLEEMRAHFDLHVHPAPGAVPTVPMIPGNETGSIETSSFIEAGFGAPPDGDRQAHSRYVNLISGAVYEHNGTKWVPSGVSLQGAAGEAGPTGSIGPAGANGADGANGATGPPGTTDHGSQTGLDGDDHPQYVRVDGSRAVESLVVTGTVDGRDVSVDGTKLDRFPLGDSDGDELTWDEAGQTWLSGPRTAVVERQVNDFAGPSSGAYTLIVPESAHGLGTSVDVHVWDRSSVANARLAFTPQQLFIDDTTGAVTLRVSASPDGRADMQFVFNRLN